MTVQIVASVTNEIRAEYEVDTEEEALRMFQLLFPKAEIQSIKPIENCNTETVPAAA